MIEAENGAALMGRRGIGDPAFTRCQHPRGPQAGRRQQHGPGGEAVARQRQQECDKGAKTAKQGERPNVADPADLDGRDQCAPEKSG